MQLLRNSLALAMLTASGTAAAAPLEGSINFAKAPGATVEVEDLESVEFMPETDGEYEGFDALVTGGAGDFEDIEGEGVDFEDFEISGFVSGNTLWTVEQEDSEWSFMTETLNVRNLSSSIVALTGTGMFMGSGYDPTPGRWSFTADRASEDVAFSFSSTAETMVPEPTTLAVLGLGLVGLGVLRGRTAS